MKRKLAEIAKEREKIINSQQKIKDDVSEMTDSFTKMSGGMLNLRKDLSDLSESVGRQMKELKEMMSSLINSRLIPKRVSPKRKKGKSSGTEHESSSDETGTRPSIHALKSWDSMCESDGENHRKQRAARPSIANDNSETSVLVGTDVYLWGHKEVRVGNQWPPPAHKQRWTSGKISRLAAVAPLGKGIAQPVIVI
jgi:hypothetical protein